jgi:hypothetical protein
MAEGMIFAELAKVEDDWCSIMVELVVCQRMVLVVLVSLWWM